MERVILIRSNPVNPDPPVEKMAKTLLEAGYDVTILAWDREEKYNEKNKNLNIFGHLVKTVYFGIPARYGSGIKNIWNILRFQMRIKKWLKKHKNEYDIIHAFDLDTGVISHFYSKIHKKKMVYHILDEYAASHFAEENFISKTIRRLECRVINHADAVIICTEQRKQQISYANPKYLTVIHNTPPQSILEEKKDSDTNVIKIVFVGTLNEGRFIEEMLELVKSNEAFEFYIGGYGALEEKVIKAADECTRIHFYGRMPYDKTLRLENECDIMLGLYDPSIENHQFAAPNKIYEAMMIGKPILVSKGIGWDEIVEDNHIGFLTEHSTEGVYNTLKTIEESKDQWADMSQNARAIFKRCYSWEIMEQRIRELYDVCLKAVK